MLIRSWILSFVDRHACRITGHGVKSMSKSQLRTGRGFLLALKDGVSAPKTQ